MKRIPFSFGLASAGLLALTLLRGAGQKPVHRDGPYWVESSAGTQALEGSDQLQIVSVGSVTVRGGGPDRLQYNITRRVRTRDEATARAAFEQGGNLSITRQGHTAHVVVVTPNAPVDLQVTVPRSISRVMVTTQAGNVDIADLTGTVAVRSGGGIVRLARLKGSADVDSFGNRLEIGDVAGTVHASLAAGDISGHFIGGNADLETAGGNIDVQKIGGGARVVTAGGTVHIGEAGGAVAVSDGGGLIDIGGAGGAISVNNVGGGPIFVRSAPYGLRCSNASGGIKVLNVDGGVHLTTAVGSLVAELQNKLIRESSLTTGAGDITIYIPSNVGVNIAAENSGSRQARAIVSDFPGLHVQVSGMTAIARGVVNGGGPLLHLTGNGGVIWIKKK